MKTAVIFTGQGSQYVGMGQDFIDTYPEVRHFLTEMSQKTALDLIDIFLKNKEAQAQTKCVQPAIVALELAISKVVMPLLKNNNHVHVFAGHSLGEYTALAASGLVSPESLLDFVVKRGQAMAQATSHSDGMMLAVIKVPQEKCDELLEEFKGRVWAANLNSPVQTIYAGHKEAILAFGKALKAAGYKKVMPLAVEGAFHTPLMASAQSLLGPAINRLVWEIKENWSHWQNTADIIYSNVSGKPLTLEACRTEFSDHLVKPVEWQKTVENFVADGVTRVIEIGPKAVLSKLVKATTDQVEVISITAVKDLEQLKTTH